MAESVADLESLYNVEATFEYTSRNDLTRALRAFDERTFLGPRSILMDHTVLITRFPPQLFEAESEDIDNPVIPNGRKVLYFPDSQILIFTMAGRPHEIVAMEMQNLFYEKIKGMNCQEEFCSSGQALVHLQRLNKQPDSSWGPRAVDYPTCVLEVGLSESLRRLDCDAKRWIENEQTHVTQVITAKIYPHGHEIIFSIWRRTATHQAEKDDRIDEIHVELREGRPRVRDNRCLRVSFEQILERPPTRGTAERDIIVSGRELGGIARRVWESLGFIPRG